MQRKIITLFLILRFLVGFLVVSNLFFRILRSVIFLFNLFIERIIVGVSCFFHSRLVVFIYFSLMFFAMKEDFLRKIKKTSHTYFYLISASTFPFKVLFVLVILVNISHNSRVLKLLRRFFYFWRDSLRSLRTLSYLL